MSPWQLGRPPRGLCIPRLSDMLYDVTDHDALIRITMTRRPPPEQLAAAVLGFQMVLELAGLGGIATVWPDEHVVTDEEIGAVADRWAYGNPWL